MSDVLQLEVHDVEVDVLTGVYSEETHLPQPLRISVTVDLDCPAHFAPASPLSESKNYLDIKAAIRDHYPAGLHYTLIEAVADHIISHLFAADARVRRVQVKIVKTAISLEGESIGITLARSRPQAAHA